MTLSSKCADLVAHFESFKARAYKDPVGIWTIGYGTITIDGQAVREGMTCTEPQARGWMLDHLNENVPGILKACNNPISQQQLDALASFVYNLGLGNFKNSTIRRFIQLGQPVLERHFTVWNKARVDGVLTVLPGLTRRRKAEYHLYLTGVVKFDF